MRNFSSDFKKLVRSLLIVSAITLGAFGVAIAQDAPADSTQAAGAAPAADAGVPGDATAGEALFKANCTSCHAMNKRVLGPALAGSNDRHDREWLQKWIKNAPAMVASGDPAALKIYNEYNQAAMTPFPQLSETDIDNILAYIKVEGDKKPEAAAGAAAEGGQSGDSSVSGYMVAGLIAVIVIALLVILVLNRVIGTLERLLLNKGDTLIIEEDEEEAQKKDQYAGLKKFAKNKKAVFFAVIGLIVVLASFGTVELWNTGVDTGYQPVQPIKFSHQLHAGTNQIDCQYCHSGAWKSKNATIPSLNVCMNCHKYVQATENYGGEISPEIKKIYTALDYNPETQTYGENPRPIEWVRIHNLPDLAYFNHSQHVSVAGIECQQCHGPIETMEEVYQYSPLTMKWCINCHRETEVKHEGNAYYDKVIAAHEQIKKGEKVTAAVLGGLECGKCHY
ncbi:MAG: c-type cytochrome [Pedobacter sp.]|nr:MAG: c-type cytochrome [Pedobacter sp.]